MSGTVVWTIDPSHTNVEFGVRHLMISTVKGRFPDVQGTVELDLADPRSARVDVTIGTESVDTRNADRDTHLRSPDFFDAATYPAIRYVSRKVEPLAEGSYRVTGDLTIRGVTRETPLVATIEGSGRDPWGNERVAFSAKGAINRSDFGLVWNGALETGGVLVGEEVKIAIDVEAIGAAAKAAA